MVKLDSNSLRTRRKLCETRIVKYFNYSRVLIGEDLIVIPQGEKKTVGTVLCGRQAAQGCQVSTAHASMILVIV